jgi:N-acetylglucosaminyldiphosphoundecaprenol N-acetyl-beta-D-mannosaminyltransferase
MKEQLLGYDLEASDAQSCVEAIMRRLSERQGPAWLACLNPHSYAVARRDPEFASALRSADWLVPDGIGVVCASRVLGGQISTRITGWDIFSRVLSMLNAQGGYRVFFLGSSESTLALIRKRMVEDFPRVDIAGTYSPPFKDRFSDREIADMVAAVNSSKSDVLWVGMTAPKQEKWLAANAQSLRVGFCGAIGAVFDFYAGTVSRPSSRMQRLGLEWLPRFINEPKLMWRRIFISGPIFIWDVLLVTLRCR